MHVIFGYKVEIDEKATREWYDAASEWGCSCGSCRNFLTLAYKRELPAPVLAALDDLHIPPEKATYVCELYSDSKGSCYQFVCCCHDPYPYGAPDFPKPHFDLEFNVVLPLSEVTYEK